MTERLRIINLNGKHIDRGVSRLKCNCYQTVIDMKIYVHRIDLKIILYTLMGFFTVGSLRGKGSSRIGNYSFKNGINDSFTTADLKLLLVLLSIYCRSMFCMNVPYESPTLGQPISILGNLDPYSGTWTRTREPGPK